LQINIHIDVAAASLTEGCCFVLQKRNEWNWIVEPYPD